MTQYLVGHMIKLISLAKSMALTQSRLRKMKGLYHMRFMTEKVYLIHSLFHRLAII